MTQLRRNALIAPTKNLSLTELRVFHALKINTTANNINYAFHVQVGK